MENDIRRPGTDAFCSGAVERKVGIKMKKAVLASLLCGIIFTLCGCGMSIVKPNIQHICWSPDQSYIVQTLDPKGRLNIWGMDSGSMWPYQELHLRWCSVDDVTKQKDVWLKSLWFSNRYVEASQIYFSPDSTKAALDLNGKITVIELSSGKKSKLKSEQWRPNEWISVCESITWRDSQCSVQRDRLPEGFIMGVVSPNGTWAALINNNGQVEIQAKNP